MKPERDNFNSKRLIRCVLCLVLHGVDDLCKNPQMARYTDAVSPLTDLAVVYGTKGFQMGFGFVTVAMPQVKAADRARVDSSVVNYPSSTSSRASS